MADLASALPMLLRHEGGYVNDPDDTPTNYGITLAVLASWRGRTVTADDVRAMPLSEAQAIYRARYWNVIGGDKLASQELAERYFDMAVLRGVTAAIRSMQTCVGVVADGVSGPKTLAAIAAANAGATLNLFRGQCVQAFASIVTANPVKVKFLKNWVGRAEEMASVANSLLR